ncbi:hypothetical protein Q4506_11770 [Colwellia sp. 4_MG-2023]|uniref:hypothetical protein n=1 Tax=unclassified Colwellia TaxID=196834 RepID=UPI001C08956A|nr:MULTISPECIES: hypothetical protein [unclassified Colwellia]MBU2926056.1 hypothetical protein [Colwellia sp. C2M11]MDO6507764.1 hypothetical protein [Colwellia sp. 5_MG-2023]MDO6556367.1 hypothetical protein [Colwellia sp. 4_MG-2023]MDO6653197.1 hypothetical protein [Colwellia sp. 3_MG-2023]MDO6666050.1 hypothetical protein [Colwellia sp. 2_MG-2023]
MNFSNIKLPKLFRSNKPIEANIPVINQFNWFERDDTNIDECSDHSRITYLSGIDINAPLPTEQNSS